MENSEEKIIDYFQGKLAEVTAEVIEKKVGEAYDLGIKRGVAKGMRMHTWMKDGITYVGNGTYTLKDALRLAKKDDAICEDEE